MGKIQKNQSGFSAIEGLLILIIVAIIGVTGWYVYAASKKTDATLKETNQSSRSAATKNTKANNADSTVASTAGWTTYTSSDGKLTLKYPRSWATATYPALCGDGVLLLGANSASVGECASEDAGQMMIHWQAGQTTCEELSSVLWTQDAKEPVIVAGVNGTKVAATAKAVEPGSGSGGQPEGTKAVQYCFVADGTAYYADYTQLAKYPDALADFNTMVTQTFKLR